MDKDKLKIHQDFIDDLKELLKKHDADISLSKNMYDMEVIQVDFNRNDDRDYSFIRFEWIDKHDIALDE